MSFFELTFNLITSVCFLVLAIAAFRTVQGTKLHEHTRWLLWIIVNFTLQTIGVMVSIASASIGRQAAISGYMISSVLVVAGYAASICGLVLLLLLLKENLYSHS